MREIRWIMAGRVSPTLDCGQPVIERTNSRTSVEIWLLAGRSIPRSLALAGTPQFPCKTEEKQAPLRLNEINLFQSTLASQRPVRIFKVARTVADLEGAEDLEPKHLSEAVQYRTLDRNL